MLICLVGDRLGSDSIYAAQRLMGLLIHKDTNSANYHHGNWSFCWSVAEESNGSSTVLCKEQTHASKKRIFLFLYFVSLKTDGYLCVQRKCLLSQFASYWWLESNNNNNRIGGVSNSAVCCLVMHWWTEGEQAKHTVTPNACQTCAGELHHSHYRDLQSCKYGLATLCENKWMRKSRQWSHLCANTKVFTSQRTEKAPFVPLFMSHLCLVQTSLCISTVCQNFKTHANLKKGTSLSKGISHSTELQQWTFKKKKSNYIYIYRLLTCSV